MLEFPCAVCRRPLSASPSEAGTAAVCPQCGEENRVPGAGRPDAHGAATCPACGAAVGPDAPACGACGELLGGLDDTPGRGGGRPTGVTLGAVLRAAGRDWRRRGPLLTGGCLLAALFWCLLFVTQVSLALGAGWAAGVTAGGQESLGAFLVVYGLAALAAYPVNCAVPLGLAGLHLAAVRDELPRGGRGGGEPRLAPLWRTRGRRRMTLCVTLLALFGTGLGVVNYHLMRAAAELLTGGGADLWRWEVALDWTATGLAALLIWVLFWPLPFLIADRPDLRHVRPLRACLRLPDGAWGGHLAAGAAGLVPLLVTAPVLGLLLPVTAPLTGLILAHAYDRLDRLETDAIGPRPLDPEGVI